jgi:uncharacterized protein YdeI (YjbR/CyaY-like superfamily)
MSSAQRDGERVLAEGAGEWGEWLARHHERAAGVWLVTWRRQTGRPAPSYEEAVSEALRFGWIDSRSGPGDAERSELWFSPRRRGSAWARSNKARVERLEREGRLAPAGRRAIEAARADGSWTLLDDVENLVVPDDLAAAFTAHPGSRAQWDAFPSSARRSILEWIALARRDATRARRVAQTARSAADGRRAGPAGTRNA